MSKEKKQMLLKWNYINDEKDVIMLLDKDTFELIKNTLEEYQRMRIREESDYYNYNYTRENRR